MSPDTRPDGSWGADGTNARWVTSPIAAQIGRVRRRAWLVLLIAAIAGGVAFVQSVGQQTEYTATSALTAASQSRAPEQDAFLAQGYAEYFNQPAYLQLLASRLDIPEGVAASARPAATSPIIYVEATAADPAVAQSSVRELAEAFRDDVRASLAAEADRATAGLQESLDDARQRGLDPTLADYDRTLIGQEVLSLLDRIAEIRSNTTNQLNDLQLDAGVSVSSSAPLRDTLLGLIGGLVLGTVVAIGLGLVENRLVTPNDVRDRLGLDTLAVVHGIAAGGGPALRTMELQGLANVISLTDMHRPITLAITTPRATLAKSEIADALVHYRAVQGERTLLVRADLHAEGARAESVGNGLVGFLQGAGTSLERVVVPRPTDGVIVLPPGLTTRDPYVLFAPERFVELVEEATRLADLVVIDAPPVLDAAEAQVVCAAADHTILVVESDGTKASDATEACRLLDRVRANVLGVVINTPEREPRRGSSTGPGDVVPRGEVPGASKDGPTPSGVSHVGPELASGPPPRTPDDVPPPEKAGGAVDRPSSAEQVGATSPMVPVRAAMPTPYVRAPAPSAKAPEVPTSVPLTRVALRKPARAELRDSPTGPQGSRGEQPAEPLQPHGQPPVETQKADFRPSPHVRVNGVRGR